ncbi:hypothetical protein IMG5_027310 [Ichthyophthirius multifiliis]|uniref:Uncharacterized protein n=1 Tax=Ichthyophthirius multifiliis TaxID=5932 RepID=G0QL95_ICHMU|nr:hypothetical protein IMG5_027310 [Ichthyophthirius multifiliis]EGR34008.1 hypothetical protein IMG5_027310 [Ichthyophthirius multifiliis]|eukprot:XP_004039312.1 hypothetical protein IMG5_027310 [Ichthyophthirius multifiliis]
MSCSILPELINQVYTIKPKKLDELYHLNQKIIVIDINDDNKYKQFIFPKAKELKLEKKRQIKTSQTAARFYDKKIIQNRVKGKQSFQDGYIAFQAQQMNQIFSNQNINMKQYIIKILGLNLYIIQRLMTDPISRNLLVYTPKIEGINKFKRQNLYSDQIKEIDKKIFLYKKKIEQANKLQKEMEFDQIQCNINQNQYNKFDFLTGIGLQKEQKQEITQFEENIEQTEQIENENNKKQQEQQQQQQQKSVENKQIHQNCQNTQILNENCKEDFIKLQDNYQKQISNAFLRKDQIKGRIRFKTPKLSITGKGNKVQIIGRPNDKYEEQMRIYNREFVPCKPYVLVPSFLQKIDTITNNVLAYLKDYRPLLQGNKNNIPKSIQGLLKVELEYLKSINDNNNIKQKKIYIDKISKENEIKNTQKTINNEQNLLEYQKRKKKGVTNIDFQLNHLQ